MNPPIDPAILNEALDKLKPPSRAAGQPDEVEVRQRHIDWGRLAVAEVLKNEEAAWMPVSQMFATAEARAVAKRRRDRRAEHRRHPPSPAQQPYQLHQQQKIESNCSMLRFINTLKTEDKELKCRKTKSICDAKQS
jgi:hypothetical protein